MLLGLFFVHIHVHITIVACEYMYIPMNNCFVANFQNFECLYIKIEGFLDLLLRGGVSGRLLELGYKLLYFY